MLYDDVIMLYDDVMTLYDDGITLDDDAGHLPVANRFGLGDSSRLG